MSELQFVACIPSTCATCGQSFQALHANSTECNTCAMTRLGVSEPLFNDDPDDDGYEPEMAEQPPESAA